jgi:hypothetical protein
VLVSIFADPRSHDVQMDYSMPRIMDFAFGDAKKILFPKDFPETGYEGAARAIYLSFAANLPAVAAKRVNNDMLTLDPKSACIQLAKRLTFEPGIAIYPGRYEKIRPVVEKHFEVDLPDFASELRAWKRAIPSIDQFPDTASWQRALIKLGYDLGPAGADGRAGMKTMSAVVQFQTRHGLEADGLVGPKTLAKLAELFTTAP